MAEGSTEAMTGSGIPYRLMLVDDHEVVRSGYRRFLQADAGLTVALEAASTSDAYLQLQQAETRGALPDLVVVDVSLGESSGLELIDRCARRFLPLRYLVFSMHEDPILVDHALQAGAHGYVSKSSAPQTVLDAIAAVRSGRRYVDPALEQRLAQHRGRTNALDQLTRRELEILSQLMRGTGADTVAANLSLSPKTVANNLSSIRAKLKVANDFQLVRAAAQLGLPAL